MLAEPEPTTFDLRFRLFGTYVRVHPMFWLVTGLLGWGVTSRPLLPGNGLGDLAVWVFCAFVSILLHEFGHVWMGRLFGSEGHIILYGMGGLAVGSNNLYDRWKRILVSFAGPGIQLVLFGLLWGTRTAGLWPRLGAREESVGQLVVLVVLAHLWVINLFWPILNLLPVWPLDGGMITREVCTGVSPSRGLLVSLWISLIVSVALAANALAAHFGYPGLIPYFDGLYLAILFALFAYTAWQGIQYENSRRRSYDDSLPWER
jgi:Zn-dependent protease